jgi:hypothetical protein
MFAVSRGIVVDKCGHGYNCMMWLQNKVDDIQQTSIRIPASGKVERHSYSSVIGRPIDTIAKHMYNDYSRFYWPLYILQHRFGTCRAAVAALARTDRRALPAG